MLARKILAGPAKPALHFVKNQQNAMLVANIPKGAQVRCGRGHVSALAQDGLDYDCRRLVWVGLLREKQVELVERLVDDFLLGCRRWKAKLMPVGERRDKHPGLPWRSTRYI